MRAWAYRHPSFMCGLWFGLWLGLGVLWQIDDVRRLSFDWWCYMVTGIACIHNAGKWYRRTGGPE